MADDKTEAAEADEQADEAPPSYTDVTAWMNALEARGIDVSSRNPDHIALSPAITHEHYLPPPGSQQQSPAQNTGNLVDDGGNEPYMCCLSKVLCSTFFFCCSKTRHFVKGHNQMDQAEAARHHAKLIAQAPHFRWNIKCWHNEQHTRQVRRTDSDGNSYWHTETYTVKVTTHTAEEIFQLTWMDTSPESERDLVNSLNPNLLTNVFYKQSYQWRTKEESDIYTARYNDWVRLHTRDVHQSYSSKYKLPGYKKFLSEIQPDQQLPWWARHAVWFYLIGLMLCGYCFQLAFESISGKRDRSITKTIWLDENARAWQQQPQQLFQPAGVQQQPQLQQLYAQPAAAGPGYPPLPFGQQQQACYPPPTAVQGYIPAGPGYAPTAAAAQGYPPFPAAAQAGYGPGYPPVQRVARRNQR